jgi:uridine kinase
MDAYYRDLTGLPTAAKAASNFDDPAAFDYELLVLHIEQLAAGNSIECPVYDFATHTRQKAIEHIVPTPYLIVEGLFALYWPLINNLYDLRLFIATDDNLCLKRRVNRDCKERERSPESVQKQYHSHVRPMYQRHILPTARKADLLLDGVNSPQQQIDLIISTLKLQS